MEGLKFVGLDRGLILVKMSKRILGSVMMRIIVRVDGLSFEASDGIKFLCVKAVCALLVEGDMLQTFQKSSCALCIR